MDFNGRSGEMEVFARVAQEGSLSAAARAITLTTEGESYLRGARRILADMDEVEEAVSDQGVPKGRLRVSAALGHGRLVIVPLVAAFSARYPNIVVDLTLGDEVVDILGG